MNLASDIEVKKLKLSLKQWELRFLEENNRKPVKDDIANASGEIQTMYKDYYKMTQERRGNSEKSITNTSIENKEIKVASELKSSPWGSDLNKSSCDKKQIVKKPVSALQHFSSKLWTHAHLLQTKNVKVCVSSTKSSPVKNSVDTDQDMLLKPQFRVRLTNETSENLMKGKALTPFSATESSFTSPNSQVFLSSQNMLHTGAKVESNNYANSRSGVLLASSCMESPRMPLLTSKIANKQATSSVSKDFQTSPNDRIISPNLQKCSSLSENKDLSNSPDSYIASNDIFEFEDEHKIKNPNNSKPVSNARGKIRKVTTKSTKPKKKIVDSDSESTQEIKTNSRKRKARTKSSPPQTKKKKVKVSEPSEDSRDIQLGSNIRRSRKDLDEDEMEAMVRPSRKACGKRPTWRAGKKLPSAENYVRINLKKKVFCRGKKQFNYRRYKFGKWKELQLGKEQFKEEPCEDASNSDDEFLIQTADAVSIPVEIAVEGNQSLEDVTTEEMDSNLCEYSVTEPMFELVNGQLSKSALAKVEKSLQLFGHTSFREGQLQAVTRVLAGLSTLVIQPTGTGKSLCYLLPAYMYAQRSKCTALVVSPLVSLMEDQLLRVPSCLKAACMHTNMTTTQRKKVKEAVSRGHVHVLFVSPESLVGSAGSPYGILPQDMPPISFVCIDEVHCVSMWSHNFRPNYLRLCRVIRETLRIHCILGLTATATMNTIENIAAHLELENEMHSVIRGTVLPSNLQLTVSRDHKEEALLNLLRREPFSECESIIIYCIRREQTERLSSLIRTSLQHCKEEWTAEAYHAGLVPSRRRAVQNHFMAGKLRVVVATVAFGMGLNKADVRAVIHYNMPKSIESYVQEIGRAGRDGEPAYCHMFLDLNGEDRQELRRHIYANTVDRSALGKLVKLVFNRCKCRKLQQMENMLSSQDGDAKQTDQVWRCKGHEVAFSVEDAIEKLDIKEEGIETILCNLEMHPKHYVQLLNRMYGTCSIFCYGGTEQLKNLIKQCKPVAVAAALDKKVDSQKPAENCHQCKDNTLEFPLVKIASVMGCKASVLRKQLSKLQWNELKGADGQIKYRKSGIVVDFKDLSFHVRSVGDLEDDEKDAILNDLHQSTLKLEQMELEQLETFYAILKKVSFPHHSACKGEIVKENSQSLKDIIRKYFENSTCPELAAFGVGPSNTPSVEDASRVAAHIRQFLSIHYGENNFSGRAIARIFHGIGSPRYPAEIWGRLRQFWRSHLDFDFNILCKMATEEILKFR